MEIPRSRPIDQKRIQGLYDRAGMPLESADIWYLHSTLCQCFLPYKDPKTDTWANLATISETYMGSSADLARAPSLEQ
jgi:hypothetical protein